MLPNNNQFKANAQFAQFRPYPAMRTMIQQEPYYRKHGIRLLSILLIVLIVSSIVTYFVSTGGNTSKKTVLASKNKERVLTTPPPFPAEYAAYINSKPSTTSGK